jgi:hypothetical protein
MLAVAVVIESGTMYIVTPYYGSKQKRSAYKGWTARIDSRQTGIFFFATTHRPSLSQVHC